MKRKRPTWTDTLLDRVFYALVSAMFATFLAWAQSRAEIKQLNKDVKNLEWGVDYYRSD